MALKPTKSAELENDFGKTEKRLVNQLKHVCNQKGQEINIEKSKQILHQLGKVYYLKSQHEPDLIGLIQSTALYNAAIARSSNNEQEIENDLNQLCKYVLVKSGARNQNADLTEHAKHVKKEFEKLRDSVKQKLKSVSELTESTTQDKAENYEKQKVILIRELQNYITVCYTKIMADLAKYCYGVMGDAPCRFALIGMGSLARKEITPYSDFEHIIVLDDGDTNKCSQTEMETLIIPYFKWFSVVFHIIIINLRETILPSVAIPSLNDFYTEENENNWFFDSITTRGISFDGLMPHACKLPIGRQKPTKQKNWKTELIKPVTNMLEYLTAESQLKNGYHLSDILTKTCFVYGDQAIYDQFSAEVVKILDNQSEMENIESVKRQINDDLESYATKNSLFRLYMENEINIKQIVYRSSTLFIAAMGRLFRAHSSSSFEVIEELADINEVTEFAKHKLMYAVALACEIRLRWYEQCKSQTDAIVTNTGDETAVKKLFKIIGETNTAKYFQIAYALQCDISKRLNLKKIHFHSNPQLLNFSIGICLGLSQTKLPISKVEIQATKFNRLYDFDECLKLLKDKEFNKCSTEKKDLTNTFDTLQQLNHAGDILFQLECFDDAINYYQKSLQTITTDINISLNKLLHCRSSKIKALCKNKSDQGKSLPLCLYNIGKCLIETEKPKIAIEYLEQSANIQTKMPKNTATNVELSQIFHILGQCNIKLQKLKTAQKYFEKTLQIKEQATTNAETDTSLAETLHELGSCLLFMNQHTEALEYFRRALQIDERATTNAETDTSLATTLHELGRCLHAMNQHTEALEYYRRALQIHERATTNAETDTSLAKTLYELGRCLHAMNQHTEALEHFRRALQIHERATTNAETDTSLAMTLNALGCCLLNMNQHTEALEYFRRALQIHERATTNAETDTSLATTLHELGSCLLFMNQHTEALEYLRRALQIHERATTNAETDTSLARILHSLGRCLHAMNQHTEALGYFRRALQIKEQATTNAETDTSLATTLHSLGRCLYAMNRHTEALECFRRALQIKERATTNAETDTSLATTLHELGSCLLNMNQHTEALEYFRRALQINERATTNAETDRSLATTLHELGSCLLNMNQHTEALEHFRRALQIDERATTNAETDTSLATTLHELGRCLLNMNQHTEALKYFRRALQIQERATTNAETDTSLTTTFTTLHELGRCLLFMNQHTEALEYFRRALQIHERATTNAETDTSLATTLHELGRCFLNMNQHTEALEYYRRALQIKERATTNAETDTSLANTMHSLGRSLHAMNQHTEALEYLRRALQIKERATTNAETDTSLARTLHELGRCLLNMNQRTEALAYLRRARQIHDRVVNGPTRSSPNLARTRKCKPEPGPNPKVIKNCK